MLKKSLDKVFRGWWIVLTCALITSYGAGTFHYGFGVFVHPLVSEMAWSMALVSGAFSLYRLESGAMAPLAGFLVDRVGPKALVMIGAGLMGTGYICLSQVHNALFFYLSLLILSVGFGFSTANIIGSSLISKWFIRKRGKAIGLYFSLSELAGFIVPIMSFFVIRYGWRATLLVLGPVTWLVVIPLATVLRRKPEEQGLLPDGEVVNDTGNASDLLPKGVPKEVDSSVGSAMHTPSFWIFAICFSKLLGTVLSFTLRIPLLLGCVRIKKSSLHSMLGRCAINFDVFAKRNCKSLQRF